ncbi:MAG: TonB family protein [Bacteriovoracaceae bacterium]
MLSRNQKIAIFCFVLLGHFFVGLKHVGELNFDALKPAEKKVVRVRLNPELLKSLKKSKKLKQVVNSEDNPNTIKPKDAKYLGKKSQSHERQTVAKKNGRFKEAGIGNSNIDKVAKVSQPKKKVQKKQIVKRKKKGKLSFSDLAAHAVKPEIYRKQVKQVAGVRHGNKTKRGMAQNNDYVEDVPMGDMTRLNTQEFKFYGFYHRIRQRLEQYWENSLKTKVESIHRGGRRIASEQDKMTSLRVVLNNQGQIVRILIRSSSGIKELDDAAIESFHKAGPFPNPPTGMVKNGFATLDWGFVVKG